MSTSRVIQFVAAALLVSIGCAVLLTNLSVGIATVCFCLPSIVLLRRSEMSRVVPRREIWVSIAVLAVIAGLIILTNHFIPSSAGEHLIHQPVVIGALWLAWMAALFWCWRKEKRLTDA